MNMGALEKQEATMPRSQWKSEAVRSGSPAAEHSKSRGSSNNAVHVASAQPLNRIGLLAEEVIFLPALLRGLTS